MLDQLLLCFSLVCFILACWVAAAPHYPRLVAAGLAFLTAAMLFGHGLPFISTH